MVGLLVYGLAQNDSIVACGENYAAGAVERKGNIIYDMKLNMHKYITYIHTNTRCVLSYVVLLDST